MSIPEVDRNVGTFGKDVLKNGGYLYSTDAQLSAKIANQRLSDAALSLLNFRDRSVIDIGCGDGTYSIELYDRGQVASLHAVDPAAEAVESIKDKIGSRYITCAVESAYSLPYENNHYDIAYIRGVLHHMEHPQLAIKEALRIAKQIIVIEPNGYNPALKVIERVSPYHRAHDEKSYPGYLLNRWVKEGGGKVTHGIYAGFVPMFCPDWLAHLTKRIEPVVEALPAVRHLGCAVYVFVAE